MPSLAPFTGAIWIHRESENMENAIEIVHVTKKFKETVAVNGVRYFARLYQFLVREP